MVGASGDQTTLPCKKDGLGRSLALGAKRIASLRPSGPACSALESQAAISPRKTWERQGQTLEFRLPQGI